MEIALDTSDTERYIRIQVTGDVLMRITHSPNRNDPIRVAAVLDYLGQRFPGDRVEHEYDFDSRGEKFVVQKAKTAEIYLARAGRGFLNYRNAEEICKALADWDLAGALRRARPGNVVLITQAGLSVEQKVGGGEE